MIDIEEKEDDEEVSDNENGQGDQNKVSNGSIKINVLLTQS